MNRLINYHCQILIVPVRLLKTCVVTIIIVATISYLNVAATTPQKNNKSLSDEINKWIILAPPGFTFSVKIPSNAVHEKKNIASGTEEIWLANSDKFIYQVDATKCARLGIMGGKASWFGLMNNVHVSGFTTDKLKFLRAYKLDEYLVTDYAVSFHSNSGTRGNGRTISYVNRNFSYLFTVLRTDGNALNSEPSFFASIKIKKTPSLLSSYQGSNK